jgi:hypothetical protein
MAVARRNKNCLNKGWVSNKECFSTNHQKGMANYHVIESGETQGVARPIKEMKYMYNPMSGNGA